jgi:hypothetical protein
MWISRPSFSMTVRIPSAESTLLATCAAMQLLRERGLIVTLPGKGSFVVER